MKTIYIKYNPYKIETEIRIDDELVRENSQLNVKGKRLQEWVEDLPRILVEECNDDEYKIIFYGTALDFDDVQEILEEAKLKEDFNGIVFEYEHKKGQEVEDKELKIKKIFEEIQKGPFEELKGEDVKKAFEQAQNQDFPVNVVATMSAGKSTLINALLGKKLMPSSQEACTATISEIQDNDKEIFEAQAFDKDGNLYATESNLNLEKMKEWNSNEKISKIEIKGDIPFVNADDTRLILMDTPGPNNSRDKAHQETTMRALSESSKTLVLYILNATQLGINDDNNLLNMVSESMKVGGKQSKDRFIFVVNKLDEFFNEDDDVESALDKVRKYLEDKGIDNPNIYPASALTALNIRTILKEERIDVNPRKLSRECRNAVNDIDNMLDTEQLHLEQYTLNSSNSLRKKIKNQLENAQYIYENEDESEGMKQLGLIHSGIIPIEEAIKIYTEKYSKTLKIKNIVDTFQKKLETQKCFVNLGKNIAKNRDEEEQFNKFNNIIYNIQNIQNKIDIAEKILKYKKKFERIDDIKKINKEFKNLLIEISKNIESFICNNSNKILDSKKVENIYYSFMEIIENYQLKIRKLVNVLLNRYEEILEGYIENVKYLKEDRFLNIKIDVKSDRNNFQYIEINKKHIEERFKELLLKKLSMESVACSLLSYIQVEAMIYKKNVMDFLENQLKFKMEIFLEKVEYKLNYFIMKKKEEYSLYVKKYKEIKIKFHILKDKLNWLENMTRKIDSIVEI